MATRGIEPITLPWKRPEKGVSAAELGASFRVEQREDGWHCTVRVGRRAEVLATGLRRLRDAQCRAEAHAATLPEVAAAKAKAEAEAAKPAAKGGRKGRAAGGPGGPRCGRPSPSRAPRREVAPVQPPVRAERRMRAPRFEQVSDGCICGKIEGGTWIADPAGKVSVPGRHGPGGGAGDLPRRREALCGAAAEGGAVRAHREACTQGRSEARCRRCAGRPSTARRQGEAQQEQGGPQTARREAGREARGQKRGEDRGGAGSGDDGRGREEDHGQGSEEAVRQGNAANSGVATKAEDRDGQRREEDDGQGRTATASREEDDGSHRDGQRREEADGQDRGGRGAGGHGAGQAGRPRKGDQAVAQTEAKEATVGKKTGKASKGEACGCMTWTEAEGKARGEAKHGAFVIEPEGKKHALYFYDPDGESRHLQSGGRGQAAQGRRGDGRAGPARAAGRVGW